MKHIRLLNIAAGMVLFTGVHAIAQTPPTVAPGGAPTGASGEAPALPRRSWLPPAEVLAGQSQSEGTRTLETVANTMKTIVGDLGEARTNQPVQQKQQVVLGSLDAMIKDLEKQCSGSGAGSMNPTKPMAKSTLAGGPGGIHDLHDPTAGEKQWGTLKAKDREQILQSKTDGFPAGYESLLQSYYRRLSNEDAGQTPPAPGQPAAPAAQSGASAQPGAVAP